MSASKPIDESTYSGRVAARLRELRLRAGLTGEQAAEAISNAGYEISPRKYYTWERASRPFDVNAIPFIAEAFGISVKSIFPSE